jgi:acetylornithine/succinyldiaminopimelate/putrescine aminotransferase
LAEVQVKGDLLKEKLEEINNPHIVQVRGKGLMLGVELDCDVTPVVNAGYEHGLLVVSAGPNVVRLVPPLIITAEEIDAVVHKLTAALQVLG